MGKLNTQEKETLKDILKNEALKKIYKKDQTKKQIIYLITNIIFGFILTIIIVDTWITRNIIQIFLLNMLTFYFITIIYITLLNKYEEEK